MTGVPRTPIGREDRRRWIGSDSVRMTIPIRTPALWCRIP